MDDNILKKLKKKKILNMFIEFGSERWSNKKENQKKKSDGERDHSEITVHSWEAIIFGLILKYLT